MSDDAKNHTDGKKPDHEPPAGAETTGTWGRGRKAIQNTATGKWTVLRKKEKPAAEIFSVSYVAAGDDPGRPVTFVFNGGPGAASAYLHMGAVGPQRVDFPADGTLPTMPPRLVENESSWLAFSDLVFVDPVGTGWSQSQIRYYIFALLFVMFDVEAVFIFPWATRLEAYGLFGLVEMMIFIFILLLGLVYAWRKGVLRWV